MTTLRRRVVVSLAVFAGVLAVLVATWRLARATRVQLFGELVAHVETRDSVVALSFDDGPVGPVTDSLIEVLRSRGVRATFFVVGRAVAGAPDAAARLVAAGHELGNHSFAHDRMVLMRPSRIRDEIERTDSLIRRAGHAGPIYFRPPYAFKLAALPWFLARTNRTTVMWSVAPEHYRDSTAHPAVVISPALERVGPGSIILLHVWYPSRAPSRAAVGPLIDSLHARGYRVVTVRELLARRR